MFKIEIMILLWFWQDN